MKSSVVMNYDYFKYVSTTELLEWAEHVCQQFRSGELFNPETGVSSLSPAGRERADAILKLLLIRTPIKGKKRAHVTAVRALSDILKGGIK